jgi:peroxiredoxin
MYRFTLALLICAALAASSCTMPNPEQQVAHNEKHLAAEGIVALTPGQPAPALDLYGTQGSHLVLGQPSQDAQAEPPGIAAEADPAAGAADDGAGVDTEASREGNAASTPALPDPAAGAGEPGGTPAAGAQPGQTPEEQSPAAPEGGPGAGKPVEGSPSPSSGLDSAQLGGYTALFFFPAPDTPNSTKQLLAYTRDKGKLEAAGISLYGLAVRSLPELESYAAKEKIGVSLLADPKGEAAQAYACLPEGGSFSQRTTVLIDAQGKILLWHRGMVAADGLIKAITPGKAEPPAEPAK